MNWLRIIDYMLLLILAVGWMYISYTTVITWSRAAAFLIPLIVIVLLFIEDRRK